MLDRLLNRSSADRHPVGALNGSSNPHMRGLASMDDHHGITDRDEEPSKHRQWAGLSFALEEVTSQEEMAKIQFTRSINADLNLNPLLYSRIVLLSIGEQGKDVILLVNRAETTPEEVREIHKQANNSRYKIVAAYFANKQLIMGLAKGHLTSQMLRAQREIQSDQSKSAFYDVFRDIVGWGYDHGADDIDWILDETKDHNQVAFLISGRYIKPAKYRIPRESMKGMLGIAWQLGEGKSGHSFDPLIEQQTNISIDLPPMRDTRPNGAKVRLRWSGMANDKGTAVTMRIQRQGENTRVKSLPDAGYLNSQIDTFRRTVNSEGGIICLSGVVGSGKTTSLAQLIRLLPSHLKVQTIEDPVEIELPGILQKTVARDLSKNDSENFISAQRAIFRSALHALYLGEIRDTETGGLARQVAESGHSVYTTTHARSALGIIDRFASPMIGIPRNVLAAPDILKLLVYQALLATNCPHCSLTSQEYIEQKNFAPNELDEFKRYVDRIERLYMLNAQTIRFQNHEGCPNCRKDGIAELNGLSGRTVVCEMVEPDEKMCELILNGSGIELQRYWRSQSDLRMDSTNMRGKTAQENAVYKMFLGLIDPFEVERRFSSFETIEGKRNR